MTENMIGKIDINSAVGCNVYSDFINEKSVPIGSVVYFLEYMRGPKVPVGTCQKQISFGIVKEHFSTSIALQLIEKKDLTLVNGVPKKDFETPTRWQKLPKGWTYNTELVHFSEAEQDMPFFDIKKPEDILKAYELGYLVNVQDNDHTSIKVEFSKSDGWRAIRKHKEDEHHPFFVTVSPYNLYLTYEAAQRAIQIDEENYLHQAALSDYDWSVEQIDKTLEQWEKTHHDVTSTDRERCRKFLLSQKNVEDIETRVFDGCVQWKYWKNSRWNTVIPD